ncbi:hypothetical protein X777_05958 [Ooceraea biroi]|uniref:Uncharacterized protein n=1 Tax=Ooceraea biroi TaxID=2015173 RepID=A0A026WDX1_OOCBI|nr:hypothetical protein X777_05958 [Ooceraea biroi]
MPAKICRVIDSNMAGTSCKLSCRSTLRAPLCCLRLVDETITIGSGPGIIGKGEAEEGAGSRRRGDRETISDRGAGSGEDASRMTGTGTGEMRKVGRGERFETCGAAHGTFVKNRVITLI